MLLNRASSFEGPTRLITQINLVGSVILLEIFPEGLTGLLPMLIFVDIILPRAITTVDYILVYADCIGAVHKVRHAIFANFDSPPPVTLCHTSRDPQKYVTRLGPPDFQ